MTDISILQPTVLRGVIERFTTPETKRLLARTPRVSQPFPVATWEIIGGARNIARPNVPNSEAHIVPRLGRTAMSAALVYLREKKVFEPTTLHWLRQVATNNSDLARTNAEAAVLREVGDLNTRFDNFAEWMLWQSLTGTLVFNGDGGVATEVNYGFRDDHSFDASTAWSAANPSSLISDVRKAKELVARHGQVVAKEALASEEAIDAIFDSYAQAGATTPGAMLSDTMRDRYYSTGTLPAFMGLNWVSESSVFDADGASYTSQPTDPYEEKRFLDRSRVIIGDFTSNRPIELVEGPTADDEAPAGFTGKFSKTWKDKDPSARQILLEWNLLPIITRPDQWVNINVNLAA